MGTVDFQLKGLFIGHLSLLTGNLFFYLLNYIFILFLFFMIQSNYFIYFSLVYVIDRWINGKWMGWIKISPISLVNYNLNKEAHIDMINKKIRYGKKILFLIMISHSQVNIQAKIYHKNYQLSVNKEIHKRNHFTTKETLYGRTFYAWT